MIGVLLPPSIPAALLNIGISLSGRVPVNLNYTASAEAIDMAIERCGLKTIFTSEKVLERFPLTRRSEMVMMEEVVCKFRKADKMRAFLAARLLPRFVVRRWLFPRDAKLDSLATIIFSSGSTGMPKGVMLSHRNIISNIEGVQQAIKIDRKDCLLGILPFFHSFGFTAGLWLPALSGFGVIYHSNPLDARKIGELCRNYRVTILISTPTFAWEYVRRCAADDFRSVRLAVVGAEKMKPELMQAFREKFGIDLFEGYGCTELSPVVAVGVPSSSGSRHRQSGNKAGTVGHPLPGIAVRVVRLGDGATLGSDQEGMLHVKGPNVMMGYLGDPEKTREVITPDGWYVTGDIARLDSDGFITITDRVSRFSKIAGEMVPHVKVEDALHYALGSSVPSLVVTSLPDDRKGERLVVLHTPLKISVEELLSRLREAALPNLWIPRKDNFFEIDALPTLGSGKLDLRRVKDLALSLSAQGSREPLPLES
jgi:acyl-[acyl-carrier-protein]-phospholipid O-acyltransferase/long-chain-fatty-acid--[acyl-carrier-protein] ligase